MWDKLYAAHVNYGYHLLQSGNPTEAIAQLNLALEVRPDGPEALTYLQQAARELAAASGAEPLLYVVAAGDTLSAIAERYGTTVEALMAANALETTDIYAGQELIIPTG
ncbi:MAG: LysM peptidoglycan-binding domain-containing protein [Anaerolineae bacterium]|nr:LysM peptidoglycan-binding domain-containing protein [Anaerolineae bacterium]